MTERKPSGLDHASWADQQISAAIARGEFDDIPGQGRPIEDLDKPYDEVWFGRKLRAEGFDTEAVLPESLQLRKQVERLPETVSELRSEGDVRHAVAVLNERIEQYLQMPSGPPVSIALLDPERVVAEWQAARADEGPRTSTGAGTVESRDVRSTRPGRSRWWRRWFGSTAGRA